MAERVDIDQFLAFSNHRDILSKVLFRVIDTTSAAGGAVLLPEVRNLPQAGFQTINVCLRRLPRAVARDQRRRAGRKQDGSD